MRLLDLTGQKFGRLTVISRAPSRKGKTRWLCKCDCGEEKIISSNHLRSGHTQSCGCLHSEVTAGVMRGRAVHGQYHTPLYRAWDGMKRRCKNPQEKMYPHYGGRGITYPKEWEFFVPFYEWAIASGYKEGLQLDRIDNNGNYEPNNCRWVTCKENNNNKRNNIRLTLNGATHTASEWADIYKISRYTIYSRLYSGWPVDRAITEPLHKEYSHRGGKEIGKTG